MFLPFFHFLSLSSTSFSQHWQFYNAGSISRKAFTFLASFSSQFLRFPPHFWILSPFSFRSLFSQLTPLSLVDFPTSGVPGITILDLSNSSNFSPRSPVPIPPKTQLEIVQIHSLAIDLVYFDGVVRFETWGCIVGFTSS